MAGQGEAPADSTSNWADVTQIAAAVSAFIGVIASLAVTGILSQAQRDHGTFLLIAFACVLVAAALWVTAALLRGPAREASTPQPAPSPAQAEEGKVSPVLVVERLGANRGAAKRSLLPRLAARFRRLSLRVKLEMVGVLFFVGGVFVGIVALIATQQDSARPSITASFDSSTAVLTATVKADGLPESGRLVIRVEGLRETARKGKLYYNADPHVLYLTALGPNADGTVSQTVSVSVPSDFSLVGLKAWSGQEDQGCYSNGSLALENSAVPQSEQDGCLVLRLPAAPTAPPSAPASPLPTKLLGKRTKTAGCRVRDSLPDPACTPGAVLVGAGEKQICKSGYSATVRDVSAKTKSAIYAEYGIPAKHYGRPYQIDHLVPLGLGGSNDPANLWPEAGSPAPGFTVKDRLDRRLPQLVCKSDMVLPTAQIAIARGWTKLYEEVYDQAP